MIILYILAVVVGALIAWCIALVIIARTAEIYHYVKNLEMDRKARARILREPSTVFPDQATGSYPLLLDLDKGRVVDPDRGLVFDADGLVSASPEVHRWAARRRIVQSLNVNIGSGDPTASLLQEPGHPVQWPTEVPLKSVATEPDIKALALGVTIGDDGQQKTIKADLGKLVHVGVGGSTGWGKSVFLRSLTYQLALSQTPVSLALVDLEGATLAPFARSERLLYPIADTERDALAVLETLTDELERRKALYAQYPGVDSLDAYNAQADESLMPLVVVMDEATALLGDKSVESALRTFVLRARKYGLWSVMAGNDWKASSLDTAIRNQLASRVQFKAMSASQSRVLLQQSGAEELDVVGRALAILPGRGLFTMQAPFVSARTIMADVSDGGPRYPMPEGNGDGRDDEALKGRIRELAASGSGPSTIAREIYGSAGGSAYYKVKDVLDEMDE